MLAYTQTVSHGNNEHIELLTTTLVYATLVNHSRDTMSILGHSWDHKQTVVPIKAVVHLTGLDGVKRT